MAIPPSGGVIGDSACACRWQCEHWQRSRLRRAMHRGPRPVAAVARGVASRGVFSAHLGGVGSSRCIAAHQACGVAHQGPPRLSRASCVEADRAPAPPRDPRFAAVPRCLCFPCSRAHLGWRAWLRQARSWAFGFQGLSLCRVLGVRVGRPHWPSPCFTVLHGAPCAVPGLSRRTSAACFIIDR